MEPSVEPIPCYFNAFEIDMSSQSKDIYNCDERISNLRQRLMQFGKIINNFETLELEMQQKQKIRAQQSLAKQIIILNKSIKNEKLNLQKLREKSNDFIENKCKKQFIPNTKSIYKILSNKYIESQYDVINKYKIELGDIKKMIKSNPELILRLFDILFSTNSILSKIQSEDNDINNDIKLIKT